MRWRAALSRALEPALGVFLAACFLLPTEAAYALVFYVVVVPCAAARASLAPFAWPKEPAVWAGTALILWSALTLCWGVNDSGRAGMFLLASAATLVFWLAAYDTLARPGATEQLQNLLVLLGAFSAAVAIVHFAVAPPDVDPGDTPRLQGGGITHHPVLGGAVYGVVMLSALDRAMRRTAWRAGAMAAAFIAASALVLTKSRGPEFAAAAAAVTLCARGPWRRSTVLAAAGIALLTVPALLVRRGDSGHLLVWRATRDAIAARPLFGHGLAADLPASLGADKTFPHNLYLSLLFYSGAIGLAVFAAWICLLGRRLRTNRADPCASWPTALLLNALLAGLTDFGQITKGPGPLWLILWVPAALAATGMRSDREPGHH